MIVDSIANIRGDTQKEDKNDFSSDSLPICHKLLKMTSTILSHKSCGRDHLVCCCRYRLEKISVIDVIVIKAGVDTLNGLSDVSGARV